MKVGEAYLEVHVDDSKAKEEVVAKSKSLGATMAQYFGAAAFIGGMKKAVDSASNPLR